MSRSILLAMVLGLCVVFAGVCEAGPADDKDIALPAEAKGEVGRLVKLTATGPADIYWDVDESMAKEGEYHVDSNGKLIVLPCPAPGTYKVRALAVIGGKLRAKVCLVTVVAAGAKASSDKGTSRPAGALSDKFQEAYKQDLAAKEGTEPDLRKITQVYKQGRFVARNVRNRTGDEVFAGLRQIASSVSLEDKPIPRLRQVIAEHLASKLTFDLEKELTAEQRDVLAGLFTEVYKALECL